MFNIKKIFVPLASVSTIAVSIFVTLNADVGSYLLDTSGFGLNIAVSTTIKELAISTNGDGIVSEFPPPELIPIPQISLEGILSSLLLPKGNSVETLSPQTIKHKKSQTSNEDNLLRNSVVTKLLLPDINIPLITPTQNKEISEEIKDNLSQKSEELKSDETKEETTTINIKSHTKSTQQTQSSQIIESNPLPTITIPKIHQPQISTSDINTTPIKPTKQNQEPPIIAKPISLQHPEESKPVEKEKATPIRVEALTTVQIKQPIESKTNNNQILSTDNEPNFSEVKELKDSSEIPTKTTITEKPLSTTQNKTPPNDYIKAPEIITQETIINLPNSINKTLINEHENVVHTQTIVEPKDIDYSEIYKSINGNIENLLKVSGQKRNLNTEIIKILQECKQIIFTNESIEKVVNLAQKIQSIDENLNTFNDTIEKFSNEKTQIEKKSDETTGNYENLKNSKNDLQTSVNGLMKNFSVTDLGKIDLQISEYNKNILETQGLMFSISKQITDQQKKVEKAERQNQFWEKKAKSSNATEKVLSRKDFKKSKAELDKQQKEEQKLQSQSNDLKTKLLNQQKSLQEFQEKKRDSEELNQKIKSLQDAIKNKTIEQETIEKELFEITKQKKEIDEIIENTKNEQQSLEKNKQQQETELKDLLETIK